MLNWSKVGKKHAKFNSMHILIISLSLSLSLSLKNVSGNRFVAVNNTAKTVE